MNVSMCVCVHAPGRDVFHCNLKALNLDLCSYLQRKLDTDSLDQ